MLMIGAISVTRVGKCTVGVTGFCGKGVCIVCSECDSGCSSVFGIKKGSGSVIGDGVEEGGRCKMGDNSACDACKGGSESVCGEGSIRVCV